MSNIDIKDTVAHIKNEFLIPVEPRETKKEANDGNEATSTSPQEFDKTSSEPPQKKQKLTGTHKHRPKLVKAPKSSKLCRSLWCLEKGDDDASCCPYPKCEFMHDIKAYIETKPPDLGAVCHNYRTYGRCHYGVVCRFGGDHIEGQRNKVDPRPDGLNAPAVTNTLKKEVQHLLRKRQYDFTKAKKANSKAQSETAKNDAKTENVDSKVCKSTTNTNTEVSNSSSEVNSEQQDNLCTKDHKESSSREHNTSTLENGKSAAGIVMSNDEEQKVGVDRSDDDIHHHHHHLGPASEEDIVKPTTAERRKMIIDWRSKKTYLAPLTTLGNLPFRRLCKQFGVDVTCGEMALATNLLQGLPSEWALVKKHASEDCFGIQLCGSNAQTMTKCAQLLDENVDFDFMDINMGCPIDLIYKQGGGSALMRRQGCLEQMVRGMKKVLTHPLTLKMRTAVYHDTKVAHTLIQRAKLWDVSMVTVHGRSKEQRYLKLADWDYVRQCVEAGDPMPVFGNGDVLSYEDYNNCLNNTGVTGIMVARGALIKPWVFKEIKEQRHWDITSSQRLDMLRDFTNFGMEHWGSDNEGVEKTRRFLLEWLSFLHRYIPVGILESTQRINQQPPAFVGRDELETLMASRSVKDWIKISEMLLGPVPPDFAFLPKHKANAY